MVRRQRETLDDELGEVVVDTVVHSWPSLSVCYPVQTVPVPVHTVVLCESEIVPECSEVGFCFPLAQLKRCLVR